MITLFRFAKMTDKRIILTLMAILGVFASAASATDRKVEHDLIVELLPAEKRLIGRDRMKISTDADESLRFQLSEKAEQISVR